MRIDSYQNCQQTLTTLATSQNEDPDYYSPTTLPEIGYIAFDDNTPVAAGFLRLIEGGYAQIDSLISNGQLNSTTRHQGIELIVNTLIAKAKENRLKGLICHTKDKSILERAMALGFEVVPQVIISLPLS